MSVDRYTKAALTVIAVALVVIAVRPWLPESGWLAAVRPDPAHAQMAAPRYEVTVPKAWGKFVAFSNNNLLLEGPDQTLRVVDVEGRAPEYPKIKVQIRWQ
ncbi:MAG TPA: hypothetical protein VGT40_22745 [Methylomirabilota bacterium]|jgi:hypothetical protein|nr:hypothetical protein [Methylomirabilota bacterium]